MKLLPSTIAEKERLQGLDAQLRKEIGILSGRLANPQYVKKAPEALRIQSEISLDAADKKLKEVNASLFCISGIEKIDEVLDGLEIKLTKFMEECKRQYKEYGLDWGQDPF